MVKDVMNSKDAMEYLGISKSLFYKLTASKRLPSSKPRNKLLFFRRKDLDDFMLGKLNDADFLSLAEAQEITGLSEKTIIGLSEQDLIPNWRRRGEYLFQRVELNLWVEGYKKLGIIK